MTPWSRHSRRSWHHMPTWTDGGAGTRPQQMPARCLRPLRGTAWPSPIRPPRWRAIVPGQGQLSPRPGASGAAAADGAVQTAEAKQAARPKPVPPPRSGEQRKAALDAARQRNAELKALRAGLQARQLTLAELLALAQSDHAAGRMPVRTALMALPGIKDPTTVAIVRRHASRITAELGKIPVKKLAGPRRRDAAGHDGRRGPVHEHHPGLPLGAGAGAGPGHARPAGAGQRRPAGRGARGHPPPVPVDDHGPGPPAARLGPDSWWRAYFTLALYCGLRPGELTGLRWEDVDLASGLIRVRRSLKRGRAGLAPGDLKTESRKRTLTMPRPGAGGADRAAQRAGGRPAAARPALPGQARPGVPRRRRSADDRQRMNIRFKDVLDAAGLGRDWQPRETRHTFVSIASEHGVEHRGSRGRGRSRQRECHAGHLPAPDLRYRDQGTRRAGPGAGCGG